MANIDLRDPNAADVGVPGAFQQANTTYTFEIDFASYAGVREDDDVIEIINLPQGFVAMGGCIETVEPGANAYTLSLAIGTADLIADGAQGAEDTRRYNGDGDTVVASAPAAADRILTLVTAGVSLPPTDGKFIVTVTGAALHARG